MAIRGFVLSAAPAGTNVITHQHSDHNAGYGPLFLLGWTAGLSAAPRDLDVPDPPGNQMNVAMEDGLSSGLVQHARGKTLSDTLADSAIIADRSCATQDPPTQTKIPATCPENAAP